MVKQKFKRLIKSKEALLLLITVVIIIGFYINNKTFLSRDTLRGTMQAMSITGIMAVGVALLLIGGSIDLSLSMVCLFGGIVCASLIKLGVPWGIAIVVTLIVGAAIGAINAFLIAKLGMMPFIATIAVSSCIQGLTLGVTKAQPVSVAVTSFFWGAKSLFGIFPYPFVIMAALLVIYGLILSKTRFGRNIYLVGGNMNAARLAGVNPVKIRSILYINSGLMSALAGVVLTSRMRTAMATSVSDAQMDAITAAILGGVAFTGGSGGMASCFIGILMLNFFNTGLSSLAIESYWTTITSGILLIVALTVDFASEKSRAKELRSEVKPVKGGVRQ